MIKSLKIQNFQSHEQSAIEFSSGVNIIVGGSDSGKTAIIRALRWLIWNRPSGNAIRSNWGGETNVQLVVEKNIVVRSKDKQDKYIIKTGQKKDIEFKAIGVSVPEEISRLLNINEINLQTQFDVPFLLSESPGVVAQHFNKVARLDKIDTGTSNVNSAIRSLEQTIKYKTTDIESKEEELKRFEHLDKFEIDVEVLEEMDIKYIASLRNQTKLKTLANDIQEVNYDIESYAPLLALEKPLTQVLDWIKQKDELEEDKTDLLVDIRDILDTEEKIIKQNKIFALKTPVNNLLQLYEDVEIAVGRKTSLFKLLSNVKHINTQFNTENVNNRALQAKFDKEMPIGSICPFCNQPIKHK